MAGGRKILLFNCFALHLKLMRCPSYPLQCFKKKPEKYQSQQQNLYLQILTRLRYILVAETSNNRTKRLWLQCTFCERRKIIIKFCICYSLHYLKISLQRIELKKKKKWRVYVYLNYKQNWLVILKGYNHLVTSVSCLGHYLWGCVLQLKEL